MVLLEKLSHVLLLFGGVFDFLERKILLCNFLKCVVNLWVFAIINAWQHFVNRKSASHNK